MFLEIKRLFEKKNKNIDLLEKSQVKIMARNFNSYPSYKIFNEYNYN